MVPALDLNAGFPMPRRSAENGRNVNGTNEVSSGNLLESELDELEGKDISEQLELLNNWLQKATRIREGAENLLEATQTKASRATIETHLIAAQDRITTIKDKIEILKDQLGTTKGLRKRTSANRLANQPLPSRRLFAGQIPLGRPREDSIENRDDYRTAISSAISMINTLKGYLASTPSPQSTPSTSSASPVTGNENELDRLRTATMNRLTYTLARNLRVRYEIDIETLTFGVLPALADLSSTESRAAAYRLLRHVFVDSDTVDRVLAHNFEWYIIRSLTRDNKCAAEREQALLFIRAIVEVGSRRAGSGPGTGSLQLGEGVLRTMISVAECDDVLKSAVLETLVEIMLIDMDIMSRTGGLDALLQALVDGPQELGPAITNAFLLIVDIPRTRVYLNPGVDLEIILSGITDSYGKPTSDAGLQPMRNSALLISVMLRSWSGLMYLCMNDMIAIRSLVNTLRIPSLSTPSREIVLDMFFGFFNIKPPDWHKAFIDGRRLTMYRKTKSPVKVSPDVLLEDMEINIQQRGQLEKLNLTDQYLALLLVVLASAGLFDALIFLLEDAPSPSPIVRKATLLVGEVLEIANRVLPMSFAAEVQSLPRLFNLASSFTNPSSRAVGTSTLALIDSFNRNRARLQPIPEDSRQRSNSFEEPVRRQMEQVKLKIGVPVDEKAFQLQLLESGVMNTKDHTKWNLDVLNGLIEGPMLNPKRFEEAFRVSKFGKRLMHFFHPFSHRFSDIKNLKSNQKWVKLATNLLRMLSSSLEGREYLLHEDSLLKQIVACFAQLDPFNGNPIPDPLFSPAHVAETLTCGYFEMLGTLSKSQEGLELLEKFHVFTALYHVSELKSREDLITLIIQNLDYSIEGHPRIVLSKALTSSYKDFRMFATQYLGQLVQSSNPPNMWTLRLLLTQLYDPSIEVCELAVHYLEEACESLEVLEMVVEMQPTLDHLDEIAHPLFLKFMSTPVGFRYLHGADYIEREMNMWFHERNYHYVVQVEVYLAKVFNALATEDDDEVPEFDGTVPPHFYGELAKTELGCQVLQEKGHVTEFAQFIRQHGLECDDFDLILKLKSVLWAVGNIGANDGGLPFLEEEEIISAILEIAEQSLVLSIRGTCFFVLGLISSSPQGAEILDDYGWEATVSPAGLTTGLCVPLQVQKFVDIPVWEPYLPPKQAMLKESETPMEMELEAAIYNLGNPVVQNSTMRGLQKLKQRQDAQFLFNSTTVFFRALHAIATRSYRLAMRRFILDLFDIQIDPTLVNELNTIAKRLISQEDEFEDVFEFEAESTSVNGAVRMSLMTPHMNEDGSDVEVDVVGGVFRNQK